MTKSEILNKRLAFVAFAHNRLGFVFRFAYVIRGQRNIHEDDRFIDDSELQRGMDGILGDIDKTAFLDYKFFLFAFFAQVKPDFRVKVIYVGGIGVLEGQELVEVMGVGVIDHEERLGNAEPVHAVGGIPFVAPDVERLGGKLGVKLGEIRYRFALVPFFKCLWYRAFYISHFTAQKGGIYRADNRVIPR